MSVLLSIKPEYVKLIIEGRKKYEFRKAIFKRKDIDKIYIYSSSPVKKIVGLFIISKIIKNRPEKLWNAFEDFAGISERDFFHYFAGKDEGFAIQIGKLQMFDDPIDPRENIENFVPPQSFYYFDEQSINIGR